MNTTLASIVQGSSDRTTGKGDGVGAHSQLPPSFSDNKHNGGWTKI